LRDAGLVARVDSTGAHGATLTAGSVRLNLPVARV